MVGGGSSTRFGADKLTVDIAGKPLVQRTVESIIGHVDCCVLVARSDMVESLRPMVPGVDVVPGGDTRSESEMAGLDALKDSYDLIGVHDAARPWVTSDLIESLFVAAENHGGAVPGIGPTNPVVRQVNLDPLASAVVVQTPQVFDGDLLRRAYQMAGEQDVSAQDTAEILQMFASTAISVVPGDPDNIKVTYPADVERVVQLFRDSSNSDAR